MYSYSSQCSYFTNLAEDFLNLFDDSPPSKLPSVYASPFPPCDIFKDEKAIHYVFAVAGYTKDEIKVSFDSDYLVLDLSHKKDKEDMKVSYRQKGIKKIDCTSKFFAPASYYDISLAEVNLENGILSIVIPLQEKSKPKTFEVKVK